MKRYVLVNTVLILALLLAGALACKSTKTSNTSRNDNSNTNSTSGSTGGSTDTSASNSNGNSNTTTSTGSDTKTTTTTTTTGTANSSSSVPDIAGSYNTVGTAPNGSPYHGTVEVVSHGDVFEFRWNVGGAQYNGVGVENGNVVAVAFTNGSNGKGCGVVNYAILSDGTLDGPWGYWGTNESGTERATRTAGSGLLSTYDATGTNPDGKPYKVQLIVARFGKLYGFGWSNHSEGIGIERGDHISVGIGGARCGFVSYKIKPDGTLDGVWGGYGTDKTGTERATKQ